MRNPLALFVALCALAALPAGAAIQMYLYKSGDDLVLVGSGSVNTAGLELNVFLPPMVNGVLHPAVGVVRVGPESAIRFYNGAVGPEHLSSAGVGVGATWSEGSLFGVTASEGTIILPQGYTSGQLISGKSVFENHTLDSFGLTEGQTFVWTWGSGADADFLMLTVGAPVPEPAHYAALAAAGLLAVIALRRRR